MSSLGIDPDIDLEEVLRISASDDWTVQFNPMLRGPGGTQGGTFVRSAVQWKGLQKGEGETFDDYIDRLEDVNEGVAEGLQEARQLAMDHAAGTSGIALIEKNGQMYPVPQGAANLVQEQGTGRIVQSGFSSANQAIEEAIQRGASAPALPSVY